MASDPKDASILIELYDPYGQMHGVRVGIDLGVRVTRIETGMSAACHTERSQLANKARALELLLPLTELAGPAARNLKLELVQDNRGPAGDAIVQITDVPTGLVARGSNRSLRTAIFEALAGLEIAPEAALERRRMLQIIRNLLEAARRLR